MGKIEEIGYIQFVRQTLVFGGKPSKLLFLISLMYPKNQGGLHLAIVENQLLLFLKCLSSDVNGCSTVMGISN